MLDTIIYYRCNPNNAWLCSDDPAPHLLRWTIGSSELKIKGVASLACACWPYLGEKWGQNLVLGPGIPMPQEMGAASARLTPKPGMQITTYEKLHTNPNARRSAKAEGARRQ